MYTVVLLWRLDRQTQAIAYLVPFNIFFIFFLVSYGRIISKMPGHAKVRYRYMIYIGISSKTYW